MEAIVIFLAVVATLSLLGLLADRFGVDSRDLAPPSAAD
jgi:hypothetical protein